MLAAVLAGALAEARGAEARFAASDLARSGRLLPVTFGLVNASAHDMTELSVTTNQLFRYRLDLLLGAGQRGAVSFAPIYFDGRMEFSDVFCRGDSARRDYRLESLQVRSLPAATALLLFDRERLQPGRLSDHLGHWTEYYFPPSAGPDGRERPEGRVLPQPVAADLLSGSLLIDSAAVALVTSADAADLEDLRGVARQCGLDLWTIDSAGQLAQPVVTPLRLRRIASGTHLRPDLFDRTVAGASDGPTPRLFQYRGWSAAGRVRLIVPPAVMALLLVALALVGGRLATWLKVAVLLGVTVGGMVWLAVLLALTPMQFVDTVSIVYLDAPSGRSYGERLASLASRRQATVQLGFTRPSGPPRPLMVDDGGRWLYQGATLHRRLEGNWSVENLKVTSRSLQAFGISQWDPVAFDEGSVSIRMQSGRPQLRLADGYSMQDAWLYLGGKAYRMGDVRGGGSYLPISREPSVDAAASATGAARTDFRKRAMYWIARQLYRSEVCILLGWQADAAPEVRATGPAVTSHGRLLVWLIPLPEAGAD